MVDLDLRDQSPPTPHLPQRRLGAVTPLGASVLLHAAAVAMAAAVALTATSPLPRPGASPAREPQVRLVFIATPAAVAAAGGGGGGNQQPGAIPRAQGTGPDAATLRVRKPSSPTPVASPLPAARELPSVVLDAKPLASGSLDQVGLPSGVIPQSPSTGSGSGGGVGTGSGTGIGPGHGPGLGPGSGGGTGGGVYRVGGGVSAPRVIKEVRPKYTGDALRTKIQGTVVLEAVVAGDGCPTQIRVVKSLDRGGLDEEAIAAVAQWRFEPGRLAGQPVDVLVTIMLDFIIR